MRKKQIEEVKAHYDADPALEWKRLEENREEFLLTTCMMDRGFGAGYRRRTGPLCRLLCP